MQRLWVGMAVAKLAKIKDRVKEALGPLSTVRKPIVAKQAGNMELLEFAYILGRIESARTF